MFISAACMIVAMAAAEPIAPTARTRYPYWQMVEDVVKQIEAQPPRQLSINRGLQTPGQEYPFESFRHLRTVDLLRAAREGAEVARQEEAMGKTPAEVDQLVLRNIGMAMEFLPLVIKEDVDSSMADVDWMSRAYYEMDVNKESDQILLIVRDRDEDPVFRKFVLERLVPGFAPESLLSLALPRYLQAREEALRQTLLLVASHPGEDPAMQMLAMNIYLKFFLDRYQAAFNSDPAIVALANAGQSVEYAKAVEPESLGLSSETKAALKLIGSRMQDLAETIAGHIGEGSTRDQRVQARTREILEQLRSTVYGVNQGAIAEYLEGKAPEPKGTWPMFPPGVTGDGLGVPGPDGTIAVPLPEDGGPPQFMGLGQ